MKKQFTNIIVLLGLFVFVAFFWNCPIESLIGIPCPGCMMTTAAYYLLQFDFESAFYFNPVIYLLVIMILPLTVTYHKNRALFSKLLTATLVVWLMIYVYRMHTVFPEYPMAYIEDNTIARLINLLK